jgi:alkylation response protein AidB-like acyl-CoA dehydrogenase
MHFNLTDEQTLFVESASRYVRERSDIENKRKTTAEDSCFSSQHWQQFAEMGWLALTLPEKADGLGCGINDLFVLMEQIGRGVFHEPVVDTPILCGSILADSLDNPLALTTLQQIGTGESIAALAHIEANGRCEFSTKITTSATKNADGWQLNGRKERVFYAPQAQQLIVSALANNEVALFIVDTSNAGLSIEAYAMIDGSHAADITLDNVTIPADALLLSGSHAVDALNLALDKAITADCARALGSMETVMAMTAEYIKTRVQYGKPLAQFQALQHRMSEMLVEYEQANAIMYRSLSLFDDAKQRRSAVSAAKVIVSKAGKWIAGQGIQLHGGIGVTEEYAVGHHYKAMLTLEQRFGTNDWHLRQCETIIDTP